MTHQISCFCANVKLKRKNKCCLKDGVISRTCSIISTWWKSLRMLKAAEYLVPDTKPCALEFAFLGYTKHLKMLLYVLHWKKKYIYIYELACIWKYIIDLHISNFKAMWIEVIFFFPEGAWLDYPLSYTCMLYLLCWT